MIPLAEAPASQAWLEALAAQERDKPTAKGTLFRYSDALACPRRMIFDARGLERDPMDLAGLLVTGLGERSFHIPYQEAYAEAHPSAKLEVPSQVGLTSGSADIVDGETCIEIKSMGGYPFDKAVGIDRKKYARIKAEGPRLTAVAQAGLNALGNDCSRVVIVYLSRDPISKQCAERVGFTDEQRVCAEWEIPESVWRPLAEMEVKRVEWLNDLLKREVIPHGATYDDESATWQPIAPLPKNKAPWVCTYCAQKENCLSYQKKGELP